MELKKIFGKSLAVNKNIKSGDVILFEHLEAKKPLDFGINAKDFKKILGKKVNKDIKKWSFIKAEDIDE